MLRIKSSTNAVNFIKIEDHFFTVWSISGGITHLLLNIRKKICREVIFLEIFDMEFLTGMCKMSFIILFVKEREFVMQS
jgi:hypothetical protein